MNRIDDAGMTPLMYAAAADFGDSSIFNLLLKSGARADVHAKDGSTAAAFARKYNHPDLAASLEKRNDR